MKCFSLKAVSVSTIASMLSDNRFTLGLGAGENLNEHVVGEGWPGADQRQDMLTEAVSIIPARLNGGYLNFQGSHFRVVNRPIEDHLVDNLAAGAC